MAGETASRNTAHKWRQAFKSAGPLLFVAPAGLLLLIFSLAPFIELARMSVSSVRFASVVKGIWKFVGAKNFLTLHQNPDFLLSLSNTVIFVAIVVGGSMIGGLFVANLIRLPRSTSMLLQSLAVLAWSLPAVVTGSVWRFMLAPEGVVNRITGWAGIPEQLFIANPRIALYSVALVTAWQTLPFAALVIKAGLLDVPRETIEAARIDGAGPSQTYFLVVLPQLRAVLAVLFVLIAVYAFRSFDVLFVMTQGGPGTATTTLPYLGYKTAFDNDDFGHAAAMAVISCVFIFVLGFYYARLQREGLRR